MPPAWSRAEPLVMGVRGKAPEAKRFLCCGMPEMAQSCYVYEQGRQSHRIIRGVIKEDWGSEGWKSISEVQGRSPGRESWERSLQKLKLFS